MPNVQKRRLQGVAAVFIAGTGYAYMSILIMRGFHLGLDPIQVIALQSWIASILLLIYVGLFNKRPFSVPLSCR